MNARKSCEQDGDCVESPDVNPSARATQEEARIQSEIDGTDGGTNPFAAAVRATRMPMVVTNPRLLDNPIVFVNDSFCRLTGYPKEDIIGRNCRFLQGADTNPETVRLMREAISARKPIELDLRNYKKDGTPFWNRLLMAPVHDADGQVAYFFASQLDVTLERERLATLEGENAALKATAEIDQARITFSEESLRLATQVAGIGTWDFDLFTETLTWSDRAKKMFGFEPSADVTLSEFYARLHPDDREAVRASFEATVDPMRRREFDVEYRTISASDRSVRWIAAKGKGFFDVHGRCVRVLGTKIDITDRKENEDTLKRSESELRDLNSSLEVEIADRTADVRLYGEIIQSSAAPICAFDLNYKLTAFNKAHSDEFFRIFGYRVKIGDVFPDLFPPDQAPIMRSFMDRALTGEHFMVTEEFGDPDLAKPAWEVSYSALRDLDGNVIGAFHYARDISSRLKSEFDLSVAQEALRQSQKMEAVGQLTGGLAHDFNNLLAVISGSLELLEQRVRQGRFTDIERFITSSQGAAKRAASLTHRLLAFSRRQTLESKPTDINQLVSGMNDLIRQTVGPSITVEIVGAGGLWPTFIDPNQLENALLNLCINARDAMPDGGKLTIETANRWLDARNSKDRDLKPGQYVSLCVSDTGTGMNPDTIARAFEPFFTTKPTGQGTGLGLSMIYGFVRQSDGQVRIYSELGDGTNVCLYLPRYVGDDAMDAAEVNLSSPLAADGETILVIDDESSIRMMVVELLTDLGYHTLEAIDGPTAMKILRSDIKIDLVLSDVGLPNGMNGRQIADAALALRPKLKILFMTGYAENAAIGHGHLAHGMAVITKPFALDDLGVRVKQMLDSRDSPKPIS